MKKINFPFVFVSSVILMPYAGQGAIAYVIATAAILLNIHTLTKLNKSFVVFFFLTSSIYIIKSLFPNSHLLFRYWQVYFGFLIFYLLFYSSGVSVSIEKMAILFTTMVIMEAILINTIVPTTAMLNIPHHEGILLEGHYTNYFGFYQRPYGPGANPSMTSTLLAVLYTMVSQSRTKWLIFTAVVLSASTTGYMLLALAYFMTYPLRFRTVFYSVLVGFLAFIFSASDDYFSYRISPAYLMTIAQYTLDQFWSHLKPDDYSLLIGSNYLVDGEPVFQTDNGWAPLFFTNGLIICITYLLTPFWKDAYPKKAPYIIFLIGAIHYPAIFSLPGQLIFALLLCNKISIQTNNSRISRIKNSTNTSINSYELVQN